jgi:hypothetical protein
MTRTDWIQAVIHRELELRRPQIDSDKTLREILLVVELPHNGSGRGTIKMKSEHVRTAVALDMLLENARST